MDKRLCNKCQKTYPLSLEFFYKNKRSAHGLHTTCKKCMIQAKSLWDKTHPEIKNQRQRLWRKNNPAQREKARRRYLENLDYYKQFAADHRQKHKGSWYARARKLQDRYRNRKRPGCNVNTITGDQLKQIWEAYRGLCAYCDFPMYRFEFDHVLPIHKGGSNASGNLVPCCSNCNGKKHLVVEKNKEFPIQNYVVEIIREKISMPLKI